MRYGETSAAQRIHLHFSFSHFSRRPWRWFRRRTLLLRGSSLITTSCEINSPTGSPSFVRLVPWNLQCYFPQISIFRLRTEFKTQLSRLFAKLSDAILIPRLSYGLYQMWAIQVSTHLTWSWYRTITFKNFRSNSGRWPYNARYNV